MIHKILTRYTPNEIVLKKQINYVFIKVNSRCNAQCEFCNSWATKEDVLGVDYKKVIEELINIKPLEINLSGGEVFVAKYFWPMLEAAGGKLVWSVTTNGSSMNHKTIDRLVENNVKRLLLSIDSYVPEQNNQSRGIDGVFERICNGVNYIREQQYDIKIIVNHVVTRRNYNQIKEFLKFFHELGVDAVNLLPIKDTPDLYLNLEQIEEFYRQIEETIQKKEIAKDFFVNEYYEIFGCSETDFESASKGNYLYKEKTECIMPYNTIFIDFESGKVYPCDTTLWRENNQQYVMGNVNQNSIEEIWKAEKFERFRMDMCPNMKYDCYKYCDPNNRFWE